MSRFRVLIGDDHSLILEGIRSVLAHEFEVVGVATNGRELVSEAERLKPDAILLDVSMPILNGMEAARQIKQAVPGSKLVFVTQTSDRAYVQAALRIGATGYVLKQSVASELVEALHAVLSGQYYITPMVRRGIPEALFHPQRNPSELFGEALTPRQREVLQLVAEGKANKEIAAVLNISTKTVEFHKAALMGELGLRNTAELTRYAIEHGIVGR
jgi:DNA-binding NarL/FixJ family response regulator